MEEFKRKAYSKLLDWKNNCKGTRAVLIEGARRIGKSTLAEYFAKNEYKSYVLIDFSLATKKIKDAFENYKNDFDSLFSFLSLEYGVKLYKRESLVIFDEVQLFPPARGLIKHLVADGRYDYLETGSLISIRENVQDILIPSEERSLKMYPMDFEEFLWAMGEEILCEYIKDCFKKQMPLERTFHEKSMRLFKEYMLVGGMPQVVNAYIEGAKDFEAADLQKRDILALYRSDIMKISRQYRTKVLSIFEQIPGFLSKHEKRVVLGDITEGTTIDKYAETFFWLGNSMMCNECFSVDDPNVGFSLNEDRAFIKCYMNDSGLLVSMAFSENEIAKSELYKEIMNDKLSLNKGMLYENTIAQMLTANGHKLYFYTHYSPEKHRNDIEIDFLLSNNSKLKYKMYPVEVKSGKNYSTSSLAAFKEKYKARIDKSYIIHPKEFRKTDETIYLPPYMTMCL